MAFTVVPTSAAAPVVKPAPISAKPDLSPFQASFGRLSFSSHSVSILGAPSPSPPSPPPAFGFYSAVVPPAVREFGSYEYCPPGEAVAVAGELPVTVPDAPCRACSSSSFCFCSVFSFMIFL